MCRDPARRGQRAAARHHARVAAPGGLPSYHDLDRWGPVFQTLSDEDVVMCLHIGTGFGAISMAPDAPIDNLIVLATQISAMCPGSVVGPAMRTYPNLKFAFSEGGIGWIPVLPGPLRPALHQPEVAAPGLRRQAAQRGVS